MLAIAISAIGFVGLVYGILITLGVAKTKEKDWVSRFYIGSKGIFGGLAAILLGFVMYFY